MCTYVGFQCVAGVHCRLLELLELRRHAYSEGDHHHLHHVEGLVDNEQHAWLVGKDVVRPADTNHHHPDTRSKRYSVQEGKAEVVDGCGGDGRLQYQRSQAEQVARGGRAGGVPHFLAGEGQTVPCRAEDALRVPHSSDQETGHDT